MDRAKLLRLALEVLKHLPADRWSYDDGFTDVDERGKSPVVECITRDGRLMLVADPYGFDDWPRMDAVGHYLAAVSPAVILELLERRKGERRSGKDGGLLCPRRREINDRRKK